MPPRRLVLGRQIVLRLNEMCGGARYQEGRCPQYTLSARMRSVSMYGLQMYLVRFN